jgi:hypothetical protein
MANRGKKISELESLSIATLDTTYVVGISGSTTYKISINHLTSSLDSAFATDLVTAALSSSLDGKLSTSSFNSYTASFMASVASGTISGSSQLTSSFDQRYVLSGSITQTTWDNIASKPGGIVSSSTQITSLGFISSSTMIPAGTISSSAQITSLGFVSGSYLTSLSGAISSSSQLTSSYDTRYTLSGSILSSFSQSVDSRLDTLENEISSSVSYAYVTYITEPEVPNNDVNGFLKPDGNISGSISYNQSTGYFTLLAGKTYKLRAVVNMYGGNIPQYTPGWDLQWKDVTNNNFLGTRGRYSYSGNTLTEELVEANAIITPNSNIQVAVRSLSDTGNTHPYIIKNSTFFFIEEMALGIVEGITGSTDYTQITNKPTLISGSSQLTTAFPSKTTGAWSVPAGASTQSFSVESGASYTMWVNGNIPNGIITWNATITTSNSNVPVVGSQYGWYYTAGNALVLTAMPDQIIGTTNTLISSPASYAPNTSNVFKFGITNNSGTTQTINYGYIKLS